MTEIGEIIRATVRYSAPGASEMLNVFHYILADATSTDSEVLTAIDNFITNDWAPTWADSAAALAQCDDVQVDVVDVNGFIIRAIGAALIGVAGAPGQSVLPAANAAYILLKTIKPKIRGIKYIPGWSEDSVTDGTFNANALADMALLLLDYGEILSVNASSNLIPGVVAKSLAEFVPFLDSGIIETIPAYQRRRKQGVGS